MICHPDKKSVLASAVLAALSVAPEVTNAGLSGPVSPTPSSQNVAINQVSTSAIVWTAQNFISGACGPATVTITSPSGQFRSVCGGGSLFGTVSTTLSTTRLQSPGTTAYTFSEAIIVPSDIVFRAHKSALQTFYFQRTFNESDTNGSSSTDTRCVQLNITSPSAAGFNVSRMALTFDGGAPTRVVGRKEPLRAGAEVNFNGSGLLQAAWEIADPSSTSGEPVYRVLQTVRQYLIGGDKQVLQSPPLPTDGVGLYLLRLRVTDPAIGFDTPVIRYFVANERTGQRMPALTLSLVTPPHQSLLAQDTAFVWDTIRGARAYQLELYAKPRSAADGLPDLGSPSDAAPPTLPATPPVTGMLVPGAQTRAVLSGAARSHLVSGQSYLWRVLAIGGDGSIVGESPVRELRMP